MCSTGGWATIGVRYSPNAMWKFLTKLETKYIFVEADTPRLPELTADIKESVASLQHHPGFVYLLAKLSVQRKYYESQLHTGRHVGDDVAHLQAAIYWANWLERTCHGMQPIHEANPSEFEAFESARQSLELVGQ
jgi:hypothetical protein